MRLHRFYVGETDLEEQLNSSKNFVLSDSDLVHQLLKVFRFKKGQQIILFNGNGFDYNASITGMENSSSKVEVLIEAKKKNDKTPKREVVLFQSLIKKDNFELITEKATEIGVSRIVPLISERSEKKGLNLERIRKIMVEAAEQCGRSNLPESSTVVSFEEALSQMPHLVLVFQPEGKAFHQYLKEETGPKKPVGIFIGPEGGWTEKEIRLFEEKGAKVLSLGENILRAETAAIVACSLLLL